MGRIAHGYNKEAFIESHGKNQVLQAERGSQKIEDLRGDRFPGQTDHRNIQLFAQRPQNILLINNPLFAQKLAKQFS